MPLDETPQDEVATTTRERLYRQHVYSAHLFAERANALEGKEPSEVSEEDRWRHRAYVSGALFAAAAFLEASINDLYIEMQNLTQSGQPRLPPREQAVLSRVWPEMSGSPILHKYQVALSLADADAYDENKPPYIDADSLLRLRDALMSCSPEWDDKKGKRQTLEKRLKNKFLPNTLASSGDPWFPDRCLGAGCAIWSVKTVQTFSDDFCHRMGIPIRARVGRERVG